MMNEDSLMIALRVCYSCLILFTFIKCLSLAQIYDSVAFLIKMLTGIVKKSVPFLAFFFTVIFVFAIVLKCLAVVFSDPSINDDEDILKGEYAGLPGWFIPYLIFVLRTSLGDFSVGSFKYLNLAQLVAVWSMWFILVVINSMIFLNFLIAVISDIYAQVQETRVEESYQKRA
jgi:hypothetical protein